MTTNTPDFNWVKALSDCSLTNVFESLRLQVKDDVETREAQRPKTVQHQYYAFRFESKDRRFTAILNGHHIHEAVSFSLEQKAIVVRDKHDAEIFSAITTLSDKRECRLKIKGQECELWQGRKMAL